jgi:hypothetical protein
LKEVKNMKNRPTSKAFVLSIVLGLMLCLPWICSLVNAQPVTTVKINGAKLLGPDYFQDLIMLEAKAKMEGNTFVSGSGSVHGILCGATYFFELTEATIGGDTVTMRGTIVETNMATHEGEHNFYGWILYFPSVEITANLDGSDMHFILTDLGLDFAGSGKVIL